MKVITIHSKDFQKICNRGLLKKQGVKERVSKILEDIRLYGDDAIIKYTKKFDKVSLSSRQLKVSASEISGAYQNISPNLASTLKHISDSLTRFYKRQIKKSWKMKAADEIGRASCRERV